MNDMSLQMVAPMVRDAVASPVIGGHTERDGGSTLMTEKGVVRGRAEVSVFVTDGGHRHRVVTHAHALQTMKGNQHSVVVPVHVFDFLWMGDNSHASKAISGTGP